MPELALGPLVRTMAPFEEDVILEGALGVPRP